MSDFIYNEAELDASHIQTSSHIDVIIYQDYIWSYLWQKVKGFAICDCFDVRTSWEWFVTSYLESTLWLTSSLQRTLLNPLTLEQTGIVLAELTKEFKTKPLYYPPNFTNENLIENIVATQIKNNFARNQLSGFFLSVYHLILQTKILGYLQ